MAGISIPLFSFKVGTAMLQYQYELTSTLEIQSLTKEKNVNYTCEK